MKKVHKLGNIRRQFSIALALLLITMVVTGCTCETYTVAVGGEPVAPYAIDELGNPAPEGAECTSGKKCADPGEGCSWRAYAHECIDTWNSETGECDCVCD